MSTYPHLEESSIKNRFDADIVKFCSEQGISVPKYRMNTVVIDFQQFKDYISKIITNINAIRANKPKNLSKVTPNTLVGFDYSHEINYFLPKQQQELWLLRTQLFYQLVIIAIKIMNNQDLFNNVISQKYPNRVFHPSISSELNKYNLGIFGSLTPTSDIDVGIQYAGSSINNGLAYIVSVIEDAFIIFTGINSLLFDIELYADMMTITDRSGADVFYMDTTNFKKSHFLQMLPYVEASILRNYVTAMIETADGTLVDIPTLITTFSYSDFFNMLNTKQLINGGGQVDKLIKDIQSEYKTAFNQLQEDSKALVNQYMTAPYEVARQQYYDRVNAAELLVAEQRTAVLTDALNLDPDVIVEIMKKVAEALIFRAESYTCPPTVMHVVRVLQANIELKNLKYIVDYPTYCEGKIRSKKAFCNIREYGYLMSILEQFGYIYRFHLTYCLNDRNPDKCKKKIDDKYIPRVTNAVQILSNQVKTGGRRKTRRVKKRKNKRTRRR
jgi:hypothetical protein